MNYKFATITHIDQVREAIKGCTDFIEVNRGSYTIFNYVVPFPETFPPVQYKYYEVNSSGDAVMVDGDFPIIEHDIYDEDAAIRRELRGITFDNATGKVIARKLHKFFNLGEKEENRPENIDFTTSHAIEEKLDGSMIVPVPVNGEIEWHTKMGNTDVGKQVIPFVEANPQYKSFARIEIEQGFTPIFEWCSPQQRIVVNHKDDRLVLLASRNNVTGQYASRKSLEIISKTFDIPIVQTFDSVKDIDKFIEYTRGLEDTEGFVITFADGHKVKLKSDWYVQLHKTKDKISHERYVVELIINGFIDDIKPVLQAEDREMVETYEREFNTQIKTVTETLLFYIDKVSAEYPLRKDFALFVTKYGALPPKAQQIAFRLFPLLPAERALGVYQELIGVISKGVQSNRNFADVKRDFFPDIKYRGIWGEKEE